MSKEALLEDDGYAVMRRALSPEVCADLECRLQTFSMQHAERMGVRFAKNCVAEEPNILKELTFLSSLGLARAEVLYDEVVETGDGFAGIYPCHQDGAYFPSASLTVSIALSEMSGVESGIAVVPRSHTASLQEHRQTGSGLAIASFSGETLVPVPLQRCDVLLNHPHLIHQMRTNRTTNACRLYSIVFRL